MLHPVGFALAASAEQSLGRAIGQEVKEQSERNANAIQKIVSPPK